MAQTTHTHHRVLNLLDTVNSYAYVEFAESSSVTNAMVLNESLFRGRQLSVSFGSAPDQIFRARVTHPRYVFAGNR